MPTTCPPRGKSSRRVCSGCRRWTPWVHEVKISLLAAEGVRNESTACGLGFGVVGEDVMVYDDFSHLAISFSKSNLGSSGSVMTDKKRVVSTMHATAQQGGGV